ncbi:MAG: ATP-dependent Clp protease ATP-binding subunit [Planctomycetes bacterium]|nr:ATP-dependent Clp protease ATP-binding subunit [Planctomycetota bacterium]
MPIFDFPLRTVIQQLENGLYLAHALQLPEASCLENDLPRLRDSLREQARQLVEATPALDVHRRLAAAEPSVEELRLALEPPRRDPAWPRPLELRFHVVRWAHGEDATLALVPALDLQVVARRAADLPAMLEAHVRIALLRTRAAGSLARLLPLLRCQEVHVEGLAFRAHVRTPKESALASRAAEEPKGVLPEVGSDLTREPLAESYELDALVARLADALTGDRPQSVLLVGPSGVGKTAAVHALVRRRAALGLTDAQFWATSGARLVAGMCGFGAWQERCQKLCREAARAHAILHLGSLLELLEVGKSENQAQGVAGFLRPVLARGEVLGICECTPEELPRLEAEDPHLLEAFARLDVEAPSPERARAIVGKRAAALQSERGVTVEPEALAELDRLHRRYATYSAFPGRPLRFLENLARDRAAHARITPSDVTAAFSRETGLPLLLLDDASRLDLAQVRQWFAGRVLGQPEAVDLVVELLATVKAGLTRPRRPVTSLLFIGPTGVGKTEMARALAEFFFGDRRRTTRFDLGEFAEPAAIARLIGDARLGSEGLLTARVREQPFSVLLFDEVEKAHPLFFDYLLQVLGDARLTDAGGRVADFTNAVVVMTSNLGAERYLEGRAGFDRDAGARQDARALFLSEVEAFLRPELLNRIDRVVPFLPLAEETLLGIARRELDRLARRDGVASRKLELSLPDEVARRLAIDGFDARYGARPLKRALERQLLVPLAEALNAYDDDLALAAEARVAASGLAVRVRPRLDAAGKTLPASQVHPGAVEAARQASGLRRLLQDLDRSPALLDLRNERFRLDRLAERPADAARSGKEEQARLRRLPELRTFLAELDASVSESCEVEEAARLAASGRGDAGPPDLADRLAAAGAGRRRLLLGLLSLRCRRPDAVILAVYGEDRTTLFLLAEGYLAIARAHQYRVACCRFEAGTSGRAAGPALLKTAVDQPEHFPARPRDGTIGLAFEFSGPLAYPRLEPENGIHLLHGPQAAHACLVQTTDGPWADYAPPEGIERRGAIVAREPRRTYDLSGRTATDAFAAEVTWQRGGFAQGLAAAIEARLLHDAEALVRT